MNLIFKALLIFVPAAIIAQFLGLPPVVIFALSCLAIIPLAKNIGDATESLSTHVGPAMGGLLNATFGNATELIIGIFAIQQGLIGVVKASITGSILGNLLLVLGHAMIVGGIGQKKQTFNRTAATANGSTLFVAAIALVIPAIFVTTSPTVSLTSITQLNTIVAVVMILAYAAMLWFFNYTHKNLYEVPGVNAKKTLEGKWSVRTSFSILLVATIAVSWISEILVNSIQPLIVQFGWTELFVGVIFIAIVGNVAEHVSAIALAAKNKMDISIQITIGSATQIIMFVAPFLVLISFFLPYQMDLLFTPFELFAMVLSIILVNLVVLDGESNWLEGVQLVATYLIMAVAFYLHP